MSSLLQAVSHCAKQAKELDSLQNMLEARCSKASAMGSGNSNKLFPPST